MNEINNTTFPIILLMAIVVNCHAENAIVDEQVEKIRPNLEKLKSEYSKKVQLENDKLIKVIQGAMEKETKAGHLDNALALKEALVKASAGDYIADILSPPIGDLLDSDIALKTVSPLLVDLPDENFSASSQWDGGLTPVKVKINSNSSWCAGSNDTNQWIQVDLGRLASIYKIGLKGRNGVDQWVEKYYIQYGQDASKLKFITGGDGKPLTFNGSSDGNSEKIIELKNVINAKYVRVLPVSWNNHISVRMEIYGK